MDSWCDNDQNLIDRTPTEYVDDLLRREEETFTRRCMSKVGLTEKKGLDGNLMLYPIQAHDKVMEKEQLNSMVKRLYKVKKLEDASSKQEAPKKKLTQKNESRRQGQIRGQKNHKTRVDNQALVSKPF